MKFLNHPSNLIPHRDNDFCKYVVSKHIEFMFFLQNIWITLYSNEKLLNYRFYNLKVDCMDAKRFRRTTSCI
jgi:hypothetical protein